MLARLFVYLQFVLPRYWLTSFVYRLARIRRPAIKNFLITRFVRLYDVNTSDLKDEVPDGFPTFNDFFIRELADEARPIDATPGAIVAPVDGTVSRAGSLSGSSIVQAKGFDYTLDDLLATDLDDARAFVDGEFATIYLAPYNYHRIHAPFAGELKAMRYVPGELFSVNAATVSSLSGLFRRNERLVLRFETARGPAAVILVGAMNVGSISTPWSGEIRPRKKGVVEAIEPQEASPVIGKGELLGWFNMGSTVIVLFPPGVCEWQATLVPGSRVRMGETIGRAS